MTRTIRVTIWLSGTTCAVLLAWGGLALLIDLLLMY